MAKLLESIQSQLPPRSSYTQVSTAQRCGFKYWLRYMAGLESVTESVNLTRGKLLHEAYDAYMFSGRASHDVALDTVHRMAQEAIDAGADPDVIATVGEECFTVLDAYLPWADLNDDWKLLLPEDGQTKCETSNYYDLKLPDGQMWPVHYKVDAHVEMSDGSRYILENKFRKNLDVSGLEHDLQILLYQAFWNQQHPDDPRTGVIYNVVGRQPRKKDGAIATREQYFRGRAEEKVALRNVGAMILNLQLQAKSALWPMNQRKECSWDCDFVGLCLGVRAGAKIEEYVNGVDYKVGDRHEERRLADEATLD